MIQGYLTLGKAFGYPMCCIEHFSACVEQGIRPPETVGKGPWNSTGFIPCPKCAAKILGTSLEAFVAEFIAPNRGAGIEPFPWGDGAAMRILGNENRVR